SHARRRRSSSRSSTKDLPVAVLTTWAVRETDRRGGDSGGRVRPVHRVAVLVAGAGAVAPDRQRGVFAGVEGSGGRGWRRGGCPRLRATGLRGVGAGRVVGPANLVRLTGAERTPGGAEGTQGGAEG